MLVYGLCLIIGGTFVFLSAVGGLDGADFATDFDVEVDAEADTEFDDVDVGTHAGQIDLPKRFRKGRWVPFLSLRFWTFALCFFGLTGLLVTLVQPGIASWLVAVLAVLMGFLCGTAAAVILRSLGRNQVNSLTRPEALAGQIGTVDIPFNADSRGKVSLQIGGSTVGFFAFTQENQEFRQGDSVLVVGLENNKLWVVSIDALPAQDVDGGK